VERVPSTVSTVSGFVVILSTIFVVPATFVVDSVPALEAGTVSVGCDLLWRTNLELWFIWPVLSGPEATWASFTLWKSTHEETVAINSGVEGIRSSLSWQVVFGSPLGSSWACFVVLLDLGEEAVATNGWIGPPIAVGSIACIAFSKPDLFAGPLFGSSRSTVSSSTSTYEQNNRNGFH